METLYRKVQFEINDKDHDEIWLIGKSANFIFNPNTRNGEELFDFLSCCEEIPDPTAQIEKLESDKAELLEKLEEIYGYLGSYFDDEKVSIGELIQKTQPMSRIQLQRELSEINEKYKRREKRMKYSFIIFLAIICTAVFFFTKSL